MKLKQFMKERNLSESEMAAMLGCSTGAVRKWKYGERIPRSEQIMHIAEVTDGAVAPGDWFERSAA